MKDENDRDKPGVELHRRAEALADQEAARAPETRGSLSPEETRLIQREHRVQQIELELQQEELRRIEDELEAQRARYFNLFNLAPVGYCVLSEQGLILEANLTTSNWLGETRAGLVKEAFSRFIVGEDRELYIRQHERLCQTGAPQACELRMLGKDGAVFWVHLAASSAWDVDGSPVCRVVLTDVAERKRVEQALRESEEKYRIVVENAGEAIIVVQNGKFTFVNAKAAAISGYSPEELTAMRFTDLVHPEDRELVLEGYTKRLEGVETAAAYSFRIVCRSGHTLWVALNVVGLEWKGGGATLGFLSDITERIKAEKSVRESERFAQATIDSLSAHLCVVDETARILTTNRAWRDFAAANPPPPENGCEGANYLKVCDEATGSETRDAREFAAGIRSLLSGGREEFAMEYPCHSRTESRWFLGRVTRFRGEGPTRLVIAHENITERKQAAEALQAKEQQYQRLFDQMLDGIMVCEVICDESGVPCDHRFIEGNPAFEKLTGVSVEEQRGKTSQDLAIGWPPEVLRRLYNVAMTGEPIHYERANETLGRIYETAVFSPRRGQFAHIFADITQREQAETALRQSEAKFRAILEASPVAMAVNDERQNVTFLNRRFVETFGYTLSDIPTLEAWWPQAYPDPAYREQVAREWIEALDKAEQGGTEIQWMDYKVRCKDGSVRDIHFSLTLMGDSQVVVLHDITERKQLEEKLRQAQKMEAVGQLAGGVAHDFNNILAAAILHLSVLKENPNLDAQTRDSLKELTLDAQRAAALTRQLLLFSRRSILDIKVVDLNELTANLLKMLGRLIGEHIDVLFDRHEALPAVNADPGMIEQVIMNLAVNARDAMPDGGRLTISIRPVHFDAERLEGKLEPRRGQFVCLSVMDTGCGMEESTLARIFEPFFTTKEPGKGTGLGLATVYGIVAQHKGWVEVESELGKGTTFKVFLPATAEGTVDPASVEKKAALRGHETILLVEDDANLRRVAGQVLRQLGYRVLESGDGQEAIKVWNELDGQIDLLFSDMVMPEGLSGLNLAQKLREMKPGLKVILSSGYNAEMAGQRMPALANTIFVQKPFDIEALSRTLRDSLESE